MGFDLSSPTGSARHKELCSGLVGQKKRYRWKLESRRSSTEGKQESKSY